MTNARSLANFATGIGTEGAVLTVDNTNNRIGIATTNPQNDLQVGLGITMEGDTGQVTFVGVVTASSFSGSFDASTASFTGDVDIADKIVHTGDTDTAIRFPEADAFTVETAGSERLRVTGIGSVGIGDTSPENTLTIKNIGSFEGDANSFYFGSNFTSTGTKFIGSGKHAQRFFLNNASANGYLRYDNTGTTGNAGDTITWQERFRVDSAGRLKVGTTTNIIWNQTSEDGVVIEQSGATQIVRSNDVPLLVTRNTSTGQIVKFSQAGTERGAIVYDGDFGIGSASDFTFDTSGTERLRVTSGGLVGIGTTNPTESKTVIYHTQTSTVKHLTFKDSTNNWVRKLGVDSSNNFGIFSGDTEHLRITSGGDVGIGTETPTAKLHVVGDARITGIVTVGTASLTIDGDEGTINGLAYPTAGSLSTRRININGAMQVCQRPTSVTSLSSSNKVQTVDRMFIRINGAGTFTISQSTESPAGFTNSIKWDCTTADSSPGASDFAYMAYKMEGQDLQHLKKGTSSALKTTVSFWVRSSETGTYAFRMIDHDNSRQVGLNYTINSADTWEYKTLTLPGDTSGALGNDNGPSMSLFWWLVAGSDRTSGSLPTAWEATTTADEAAGLTANIAATTDSDFYLTGLQFEVGEKATPFEHRSYGDELARCRRYYYQSRKTGDTYNSCYYGYGITDNRIGAQIRLPVAMRSAPAFTLVRPSDGATNAAHQFKAVAGSDTTATDVSFSSVSFIDGGEVGCPYIVVNGSTVSSGYLFHIQALAEL